MSFVQLRNHLLRREKFTARPDNSLIRPAVAFFPSARMGIPNQTRSERAVDRNVIDSSELRQAGSDSQS